MHLQGKEISSTYRKWLSMQWRAVTDMALPSNLESEWDKTTCSQSTGTEYHTQPCVCLEQGPDVGSCEHSNQLSHSSKDGNSLTSSATVLFSEMTLLHGISHW